MDEKIPLPDGGWALIRDPRRVTERKRRPVIRAQGRLMASAFGGVLYEKEHREAAAKVDGVVPPDVAKQIDEWSSEEMRKLMGSEDAEITLELDDRLIDALVAEWSYDGTPSAEASLDLPGEVVDALKKACSPHLKALTTNFDPSEAADETSPTGASPE